MPSPRAAAASVLIATLLTGILFRIAPPVEAAGSCTGWASTVTPPSHINVLRTALGRVETVPFRRYVEVVMAAEWGPSNPREALRAGAVAVKQYAWYYAMAGNWRGGSVGGRCFDVRDSTSDQLYRPETKIPASSHVAAVAASWAVTVRNSTRPGGFFPTQYNNGGPYARCGTGLTGHTLRQVGASNCAASGYSFQRILRLYYGPGARLVIDPARASEGSGPTDVGLLFRPEPDRGQEEPTTNAVILSSDGKDIEAASEQSLPFSLGSMLGRVTEDLTGDHHPDLAVLLASPDGPRISVFPGNGDGFAPGVEWWHGGTLAPTLVDASVRLLAGDWDGDGRKDLGLVAQDADGGSTTIYELRGSTADGAGKATLAWKGDPGGTVWAAFGGDFSGDGQADVALLVDAGKDGTRLVVLAGTPGRSTLKAPRRWATDTQVRTNDALPFEADIDGDGRADIVLVEGDGAEGLRFVGYHSTGRAFQRVALGAAADDYPWQGLRVGVADLDRDGREDLFALVPDGTGARVEAFFSRSNHLAHASWGNDAGLELGGAATY